MTVAAAIPGANRQIRLNKSGHDHNLNTSHSQSVSRGRDIVEASAPAGGCLPVGFSISPIGMKSQLKACRR